jgi:phosphonate degradation associated HDIG domain protein
MDVCEFLFETLAVHGGSQYGMERVSQLEHALQCAALAEREGAHATLIVAALFHDLGHLIGGVAKDSSRRPVDDRHETMGAAMLSRWFDEDVAEPVRLHVPAKRYLCAVDASYHDGLSWASSRSLELQGKAYDRAAAEAFIRQPYAEEAIRLRRWDDRAKATNCDVPRLDHYRPYVEGLLIDRSPPGRAAG